LYYFKVAARNVLYPTIVGTLTNYDVTAMIMVVPGPPIINPRILAIAATRSITLTWTAPSDTGGGAASDLVYTIQYSKDIGEPKQWAWYNNENYIIAGNTVTITNLVVGNHYYFRVYAINTIGRSVPSDVGDTPL
jgi:hypothetical protein